MRGMPMSLTMTCGRQRLTRSSVSSAVAAVTTSASYSDRMRSSSSRSSRPLVTPQLTGTILEGVTRDSILELAKDLGLTPVERRVTIEEWIEGCNDGTISEIFACGTAAVVTPVGRLVWTDGEVTSGPEGEAGPYATKIREALLAIQKGTAEDTRGWMTRLV